MQLCYDFSKQATVEIALARLCGFIYGFLTVLFTFLANLSEIS
jgi:hypothetical protein